MSEKKAVKFSFAESGCDEEAKSEQTPAEAPNKTVEEEQKKAKGEEGKEGASNAPAAPSSTEDAAEGGERGDEDRQAKTTLTPATKAKLTPILRDQIRASEKYIHCHECGKDIPLQDWPDHRDGLRKINLVHHVSSFSLQLMRFIGEFIMWFLKSVYFREVTVVGAESIPQEGAVVFYGNHQNQFIDALMMNSSVGRPVRFIMAEKSYNTPIIGHLGKLFHSVPVIRPQDVPLTPGVGKLIGSSENLITGEGTAFTSNFAKGDVIMWMKGKQKCTAQVQRISSDTEIELTFPIKPEHEITEPTEFKISRRIDHSEMYAQVYDTLKNNHCIGIFPEGGSHDHTSLQPLKAGVALFSLGAAERNISVKVVPCGMTYLFGSKFRSRAYVEFGEPIAPPEELVEMFKTDKRKATGLFLEQLNDALRGITINVADYRSLKLMHAFRQLYQPQNCLLSAREYLRLTRRLSLIVEARKDEPDFQDFRAKVENYSDYCKALLVRDSQAATLKRLGKEAPEIRLLLRRGFTLYMMIVILVPFFVVALPIGGVIHYLASKKKSKALSESRVKIVGADVKSSFNIMMAAYVIPPYLFCITMIVYFYTDWNTAMIVLFCLPMAMYISLLIVQEAVMELRAALPLFMSLISQHKQFRKLYEKREDLVVLAKKMVSKYDPQLEKEMEVFTNASEVDDEIEREPSLFSLRYNIRRRMANQ